MRGYGDVSWRAPLHDVVLLRPVQCECCCSSNFRLLHSLIGGMTLNAATSTEFDRIHDAVRALAVRHSNRTDRQIAAHLVEISSLLHL